MLVSNQSLDSNSMDLTQNWPTTPFINYSSPKLSTQAHISWNFKHNGYYLFLQLLFNPYQNLPHFNQIHKEIPLEYPSPEKTLFITIREY